MNIKIWKATTSDTIDGVGYGPEKVVGVFRDRDSAVDCIAKLESIRRGKRTYKSEMPVDIKKLLGKSNYVTGEDWNHWAIKKETVNVENYLSILTDDELTEELNRRKLK